MPAWHRQAPPPVLANRAALRASREQQALAGISRWRRAAREQAITEAHAAADAEADRHDAAARAEHDRHQQALDQQWHQLSNNDPATVTTTVTDALDEHQVSSVVLEVSGSEISLAILVGDLDDSVAADAPDRTPSGRSTKRRLGKRERASAYRGFVCGQAVTAVNHALAVAPGVSAVRIVALRIESYTAYGHPHLGCLLAARFTRPALVGVRWDKVDAATIIDEAATEHLIHTGGPTHELRPLDLTEEPDLRALLDAVEITDEHGTTTLIATPQPEPPRSRTPTAEPADTTTPTPAAAPESTKPRDGDELSADLEQALADTRGGHETADLGSRLRPARLAEVIGQRHVVDQLDALVRGALQLGRPAGHVLLCAEDGMGKATLAQIVGNELGSAVRMIRGEDLSRPGDLAAMLSNLVEGDVLFLDHLERLDGEVEGMLRLAVEHSRVEIRVGRGLEATVIPLDVAPFTLIAATETPGSYTGPLHDHFELVLPLSPYQPDELDLLLRRAATAENISLTPAQRREIVAGSRAAPASVLDQIRLIRPNTPTPEHKPTTESADFDPGPEVGPALRRALDAATRARERTARPCRVRARPVHGAQLDPGNRPHTRSTPPPRHSAKPRPASWTSRRTMPGGPRPASPRSSCAAGWRF